MQSEHWISCQRCKKSNHFDLNIPSHISDCHYLRQRCFVLRQESFLMLVTAHLFYPPPKKPAQTCLNFLVAGLTNHPEQMSQKTPTLADKSSGKVTNRKKQEKMIWWWRNVNYNMKQCLQQHDNPLTDTIGHMLLGHISLIGPSGEAFTRVDKSLCTFVFDSWNREVLGPLPQYFASFCIAEIHPISETKRLRTTHTNKYRYINIQFNITWILDLYHLAIHLPL